MSDTGNNAVEDFGSYQHVNGAAVLAAVATNIIHGEAISHFMV